MSTLEKLAHEEAARRVAEARRFIGDDPKLAEHIRVMTLAEFARRGVS